jgi:LPPG:FO 2-phospho-L-lactate transferase
LIAQVARSQAGSDITIIGNTADDLSLFGLHVSPDLDTVMYTLGGGIDKSQGWGRADETLVVQGEVAAYGVQPQWFTLGDRDIATHIVRTQMLAGYPLSAVTKALCARWFADLPVPVSLVPMTDDRVETHVVVQDPDEGRRAIHFQEWWVRHRAGLPAERFVLVGIEQSRPAPGVLEAIRDADVVLLPPSNPVVSIGPIVSVPGVRDALRTTSAPVVGLSPIVGGRPVRGMADACLAAIGVESSAAAVAGLYRDFLDGWLIDESDAVAVDHITQAGPTTRAVPLLMTDVEAAAAMACEALDLADAVRS